MKPTQSIDSYIKQFPPSVQKILKQIRQTIRSAAPGAQEKIAYGVPTFFFKKNLVHFAAFKKHISFFPTSSPIRAKVFEKALAKYEVSKGTIKFPFGTTVPYGLIKKIVLFRVKEVAQSDRASKS